MELGRREFLKAGGAGIVLVSGGTVLRAADQGVFATGEGPAYEPWDEWRTDTQEGPIELVRAAVLASNPHNSQPWLFRASESRIDLFADTDRNIGTIDPYLREMHIGLGCALENLSLAARANGYTPEVTLVPNATESTHVARIDLFPADRSVSKLYEAIARRHTDRGAYADRPVPQATLDRLTALGEGSHDVSVRWLTTPEERRRFGDLIVRATEAIINDEEQTDDSAHWYRDDWDEIQRHRDGVTLDAQGTSDLLRAVGKIVPPTQRTNDRFWVDATRDRHTATAAAYGVYLVADPYDRRTQLRGGRLWQRMHLRGTAEGLAMYPMNQLTERIDRKRNLGERSTVGEEATEVLGAPNRRPLFTFQVGYPTAEARPSPRRAVEEVAL